MRWETGDLPWHRQIKTAESLLVRLAGIEPTTLGFGGQYSIHWATAAWENLEVSRRIQSFGEDVHDKALMKANSYQETIFGTIIGRPVVITKLHVNARTLKRFF
jgi:hypothetical protein